MKVAFLSNKLTLRGTEIAMYDYADYNETLLGNKSIIITRDVNLIRHEFDVSPEAYDRFHARFPVEYYQTREDIDAIVLNNEITHLYIIKAGGNDGLYSTKCKNIIHCVFTANQPHGEAYTVVSEYVNESSGTSWPVLPHMIRVHNTTEDLRQQLNIPEHATVFGRYGGADSFDIDYVKEAIRDVLFKDDIYFIFMNTYRFIDHPRVIYLQGTTDLKVKRMFINTSDALLHARRQGESFGLTCGEFAVCLKPVITCHITGDRHHLNTLKDKAITYGNYEEVLKILSTFKPFKLNDNGYLVYTPENVMNVFKDILKSA